MTATTDLGLACPDAPAVVAAARTRADALAAQSGATSDDLGGVLAVAADQFIVRTPTGPTAVAGYPWFGEWSRDLFTSYEGLFLCTGRAEEGRSVLVRAAGTVSEGMLANTADVGTLEYNTIDATLWFLHALGRHVEQTRDVDLAAELADTVVDVLSAHRAGTRFGIQVDPATGLLRGGASGWALTWMDARIDGRPVTPRAGFPVEVEALWINGLGAAVDLLGRVGRPADEWVALRDQAISSFTRLFPVSDSGLPDVVDDAGQALADCRPNQLLAASLPYGPVKDVHGGRRDRRRLPRRPGDLRRVCGRCLRRTPHTGVSTAAALPTVTGPTTRAPCGRGSSAPTSTPHAPHTRTRLTCSTGWSCTSPSSGSARSRRRLTETHHTPRRAARSRRGRLPSSSGRGPAPAERPGAAPTTPVAQRKLAGCC